MNLLFIYFNRNIRAHQKTKTAGLAFSVLSKYSKFVPRFIYFIGNFYAFFRADGNAQKTTLTLFRIDFYFFHFGFNH